MFTVALSAIIIIFVSKCIQRRSDSPWLPNASSSSSTSSLSALHARSFIYPLLLFRRCSPLGLFCFNGPGISTCVEEARVARQACVRALALHPLPLHYFGRHDVKVRFSSSLRSVGPVCGVRRCCGNRGVMGARRRERERE